MKVFVVTVAKCFILLFTNFLATYISLRNKKKKKFTNYYAKKEPFLFVM